jgi:5-bromo-4-chloroindolyl phosphate hydrolysis protein
MRQHPDLRPEEVYAALTYFYDHYDELVQLMASHAIKVNDLREQQTLSRAELLARQKRA